MYYIGVDLGGTSVKVGLIDEKYQMVAHQVAPTGSSKSAQEIVEDIAKLCYAVIEEKGIKVEEVHSIGIGCPGIASPKEGVIIFASNLKMDHVNVRELMKKHIDLEVYVDNDANCAALGEAICGAAKGKKDVVMVTLGTGVGGGILQNGKIHHGAFCGAGEVGHHVMVLDGELCGCGRKGCWEQYASATALIKQGKKAIKDHPETKMLEYLKDKDIELLNAKIIFDAAKEEDATARAVLDQYFKYVAYGITNLIYILEPDTVVLGGGMSAQKENLIDPVVQYVTEEMKGGFTLRTEIKAAELGNQAGIIGAALIGKYL